MPLTTYPVIGKTPSQYDDKPELLREHNIRPGVKFTNFWLNFKEKYTSKLETKHKRKIRYE